LHSYAITVERRAAIFDETTYRKTDYEYARSTPQPKIFDPHSIYNPTVWPRLTDDD